MLRAAILLLPPLALVLCVPWGFDSASEERWLGLPVWGAFSIAMAALFASMNALLFGRCWELSARAGDGEEGDDRDGC